MTGRPIMAEAVTADGVRVVLFEDTWLRHILNARGRARSSSSFILKAVLEAIESPDHTGTEVMAWARAVLQARRRAFPMADGRRKTLRRNLAADRDGFRLQTRTLFQTDGRHEHQDRLTSSFDRGRL